MRNRSVQLNAAGATAWSECIFACKLGGDDGPGVGDCCGEAGREWPANVELKAVLAAVQQNGYALEHANVELKVDREVVLTAVQRDGRAL